MATRLRKATAGMALLLALLLALPVAGFSFDADGGDVEAAMQSFYRAMVRKNRAGVLAAFSRQQPMRMVNYEIGTGRRLHQNMISYQTLAADFRSGSGWSHFFFDEPNGYTFRLNFMRGEVWKRQGNTFYHGSQGAASHTYIKWRRIRGKWAIVEIGDTAP